MGTVAIEWYYWAYAASHIMIVLSCTFSSVAFLVWCWEIRQWPRPDLWVLLPGISAIQFILVGYSMRWLWPRIGDPSFAISMIQTVAEKQSYWSYWVTNLGGLMVVWLLLVCVWLVRAWKIWPLAGAFVVLASLSTWAAVHHQKELRYYCAREEAKCAVSGKDLVIEPRT